MLRRTALLGICCAAGLVACAPTQHSAPGSHQKLVIQVSDGDTAKWNLALNSAKNVQGELGAANVDSNSPKTM